MARNTINAFLPAMAAAASEEERQQIGQRMLRGMKQSLLPRTQAAFCFQRNLASSLSLSQAENRQEKDPQEKS